MRRAGGGGAGAGGQGRGVTEVSLGEKRPRGDKGNKSKRAPTSDKKSVEFAVA